MIIEEISIRNWRGYRDLHTFHFNEGFNLLVGRNEAGKSTIFEAFTRVLFDRHNSQAEGIRQIQPICSTLGPQATIIFKFGDKRYKICKRFLQKSTSEFYTYRKGKWDLDHEGDDADNTLLDILHGELPSRTPSRAEHRGMCQALWYLQKDDPLPKNAWTEGVKQGLSGIIDLVARSPIEDDIIQMVNDEYKSYYTPTGRISSSSELRSVETKIQLIEDKLKKLYDNAEQIEGLRADLEEFYADKNLKKNEIDGSRMELDELKETLADASEIECKKNEQEKFIGIAITQLKDYSKDLQSIERRNKKIDDFNRDLERSQNKSIENNSVALIEKKAAEKHHLKWKNDLEPQLKGIESDLSALQSLERVIHLNNDKIEIQEKIDRIEDIEKRVQSIESDLREIPATIKRDWKDFREKNTELTICRAKAEQIAIRIGFNLNLDNKNIIPEPIADYNQDENEYLILGPTTFTIGDIGKITVRGGDSSLEKLKKEEQELIDFLSSILEKYHVDNEDALVELSGRREFLGNEIKKERKGLDSIIGKKSREFYEKKLEEFSQAIISEESKIIGMPSERREWSTEKILKELEEKDRIKSQLIKGIEDEQEMEVKARESYQKALTNATNASGLVIELNSKIQINRDENEQTLKSYGTLDHLNQLVINETNKLTQLKTEFDKILKDYKSKVEEPRKQFDQVKGRIDDLSIKLNEIDRNITDRQARIETIVSENIYSETGDLEAELEVKKRRLEYIQRNADAIRLLHDMVDLFKHEQSSALSGPVSELLNRWLALLTNDSYKGILLNSELIPVSLESGQYDEPFPLTDLSYGTHEQVVVLLRLAIGVILSKTERNLVVIDDRLVNADPIRMRRFCQIFSEVSKNHCQILVATCNDTLYAGIQGNIIHVPEDGRV